ncbi:MAG: 8-amino-7-oxononanoate synthase [Planctomycetes bacterium]|nr:8-amino-7-oxononanoate synthase [Planctomycetota bacterium]
MSWPSRLQRRLDAWRDAGLQRRLRVAEGSGTRVRVDGRELVSFASNDYLGLSTHPDVLAAAHAALDRSGAGATASRLICGTKSEHAELEADLARFKRSEGALVFASGYQAALAALVALGSGEEDPPPVLLLDRLCHASLLDGAKLSGARVRTFKHNDAADLERLLRAEAGPPALAVVESLYSMDGDVAPLRDLYAAVQRHGAWLLVDEAHATGVLGPLGRGALAEVFEGEWPGDVLSLGTLSKALGSQGGFLCGPKIALESIVHAGRAFVFSTGLAPAPAAAARVALGLLKDDARRLRLLEASENLRRRLRADGWEILGGPGPILPIRVGDEADAVALAERLWSQGFWVPAVRYPTVKRGQARLRLSLSAAHTPDEIQALLTALGKR